MQSQRLTVSRTPPLVSGPHHSPQTLSAVEDIMHTHTQSVVESHSELGGVVKVWALPELEVAGLPTQGDQT